MKFVPVILAMVALAGCAHGPTQSQLELSAYDRVLDEKVAKGQLSRSEAELAHQQYAGGLSTRDANNYAATAVGNSNNAYANNSTTALGMALMCAGQRGGHC